MRRLTPKRLAALLLLALPAFGPVGALAQIPPQGQESTTESSAFPNTRLTFVFGDDNVLVDAGETKNSSPAPYFGRCNETDLDRASPMDCGGLGTNLLLYKRLEFSPFFQPEAALSLDVSADGIADSGSYLRANYFMDDRHETYWSITMFPVDSDSMRLGFHHDINWGGTDSFPKNFRRGAAPGLQYQLDMRYWYLFVGAKTALVRSPAEDILDNPGGNTIKNVERTFYGFLGGVGFEILDTGLRFEVNGGFFNKGTNTRQNALGKPIYSGGVSGRVSYRTGLPIGRQIDLRLFQIDKLREELLRREVYRTGDVSIAVELETTYLVQDLEDPDRVNSTKLEESIMGHLGFKLKYGQFRLHIDAIFRDLTAITFDVPGFVPYQALSEDVDVSPEIFGSIAADYNFQPWDITVGLAFGILQPATYAGVAPVGATASGVDLGRRKVVVRGARSGDWDILPAGEDELPVYMVRFDVKWSYYDKFQVLAELSYGRDDNRAQIFQDAQGHNVRQFDEANSLGFMLMAVMQF